MVVSHDTPLRGGLILKYPFNLLLVVRVQNGFKVTRGERSEPAMEEYVAENDETVLKLVKEHLESLKPTETDKDKIEGVKQQYEERYNYEDKR